MPQNALHLSVFPPPFAPSLTLLLSTRSHGPETTPSVLDNVTVNTPFQPPVGTQQNRTHYPPPKKNERGLLFQSMRKGQCKKECFGGGGVGVPETVVVVRTRLCADWLKRKMRVVGPHVGLGSVATSLACVVGGIVRKRLFT